MTQSSLVLGGREGKGKLSPREGKQRSKSPHSTLGLQLLPSPASLNYLERRRLKAEERRPDEKGDRIITGRSFQGPHSICSSSTWYGRISDKRKKGLLLLSFIMQSSISSRLPLTPFFKPLCWVLSFTSQILRVAYALSHPTLKSTPPPII